MHATSRSYYPAAALPQPRFGHLPRSLATTEGIIVYFLFLQVLRCFSSPGSPHRLAVIPAYCAGGLSHSEIRGSRVICTLPRLIAAYHVLRRLCEPRHPPYALSYFLRKTLKETKRIYLFLSQVFAHTFSCQVKYKSHDLISIIELMFYFTVLLVSICQRTLGQPIMHDASPCPSWRITDSNR